jgi:hypothetical protein
MVNRIQGPNFSQAKRDATTQKLQQIAQAQEIQDQPKRSRLLDLDAESMEQEMALAPKRLALSQQTESRQQSIFESDEEAKRAANFITSAPVLNAEARRIRALPRGARQAEVDRLKPALESLNLTDDLDLSDMSDEAWDQAISVTGSVIKQAGGRELTAHEKNFMKAERLQQEADEGIRSQDSVAEFRHRVGLRTPEAELRQEAAIAGAKEKAKFKEKRVSDVKVELAERNRTARRTLNQAGEALVLVRDATQGIQGAVKLQLGRVFPGLDTEDEAALDSKLSELAIAGLQAFKGPTTDFELRYIENIAGKLSAGESANAARLTALQRAMWLQERELKQFNDFVDTGGDPDRWRGFDINEVVNTARGPITLKDIQETAAANHVSMEEALRRFND